jgi:hypothetical protein
LVGWGIALVIHAVIAFRGGGNSLEDRMTEREYEKLKRSK